MIGIPIDEKVILSSIICKFPYIIWLCFIGMTDFTLMHTRHRSRFSLEPTGFTANTIPVYTYPGRYVKKYQSLQKSVQSGFVIELLIIIVYRYCTTVQNNNIMLSSKSIGTQIECVNFHSTSLKLWQVGCRCLQRCVMAFFRLGGG